MSASDIPNWEMAKENIQPIKVGRKVSRLQPSEQDFLELERYYITLILINSLKYHRVHQEEIANCLTAEEKLKSWIRYLYTYQS